MCADGSPLSDKCVAKGCNKCPGKKESKKKKVSSKPVKKSVKEN
jgi:hypothetical protein